jgi:hypothetical protein
MSGEKGIGNAHNARTQSMFAVDNRSLRLQMQSVDSFLVVGGQIERRWTLEIGLGLGFGCANWAAPFGASQSKGHCAFPLNLCGACNRPSELGLLIHIPGAVPFELV